ncbi:hypothetical protein ASE61_19455 [Bosea sp. Root670]|nr:hypothetical protein ASE61_19455 [Bosea sp. Root670]
MRDAVVDDVRAARLDRPDVRGVDLSTTASVDQLEAGDNAALIIGADTKWIGSICQPRFERTR